VLNTLPIRHQRYISLVEESHHKVSAISSQPMKQPYCVLLASVGALSRSGWPCTKGNSSKRFRYNCNGLDRQHRSLFPPNKSRQRASPRDALPVGRGPTCHASDVSRIRLACSYKAQTNQTSLSRATVGLRLTLLEAV
jgi:hypothetical protein